jgi:uncharacterized integral membrane protein
MRAMVVWLIVLLLAVTIFALSNTGTVDVRFWQWTIYSGPLAMAVIGAGVLGALFMLLPALARHSHLSGRVRDLERQMKARGTIQSPASPPARRDPEQAGDDPPGPPRPPFGRIDDTRRLP